MEIHLLGYNTTAGSFFHRLASELGLNIISYSRNKDIVDNKKFFNIKKFNQKNLNKETTIISFLPIWYLKVFLESFNRKTKKSILIKKMIVCSSTSILTKKFSPSENDKKLVEKLESSENYIRKFCEENDIFLKIVRPTIIYGNFNNLMDKNYSIIIKLMTKLWLFPFPIKSGLRQPIHCKELANVFIYLLLNKKNDCKNETIEIGGDEILTYFDLIKKIQVSLPSKHPAKKCLIVEFPDIFFNILFIFLFVFSPKYLAILQRLKSNLSGFKKVSELTKSSKNKFPYGSII